jgi:hypothetical protein
MQLSFRSKVATATVIVTAIWVGVVAVIITDGAEAEDIIMVGVIIATIAITCDLLRNSAEAASVGGHFSMRA